MDTIYAMASASGRAGVAVVRVSGPDVAAVCGSFGFKLPETHRAVLRLLRTERGFLDRALVLFFAEGHSFTGEPVIELQLHGSPAITRAVLAHLATVPGCRAAEAGEFTRRALENGRLSLTEVEGLADLLQAETETQRVQASRLFQGELARTGEDWRRRLLASVAHVEALIDFSEEGVGEELIPQIVQDVRSLREDIEAELHRSIGAERVAEGFEVALVGLPNSGKSTLLNRIARREAALTSEYAGTTRDVIELRYDLKGLPVTFLDTAGVRETSDPVETLGVELTRSRAVAADLRVFLGTIPDGIIPTSNDILVGAKADLVLPDKGLAVSGLTGDGVDELLSTLHDVLSSRVPDGALAVHARHRAALERASAALAESLIALEAQLGLEIVAESLRTALRAMEMMLGRVGVEDILGEIFSSFCIGK